MCVIMFETETSRRRRARGGRQQAVPLRAARLALPRGVDCVERQIVVLCAVLCYAHVNDRKLCNAGCTLYTQRTYVLPLEVCVVYAFIVLALCIN